MNSDSPLAIVESVNLTLFLLCAMTAAINIPFGIIRAGHRRFSWPWLLAVHLPVPIIIALRLVTHQGWDSVPLLIACAIAGQVAGGMIRQGPRRAATEEE